MSIKFSADGLIEGGIECYCQILIGKEENQKSRAQRENVVDLMDWIRQQFITLRDASEQKHQNGDKKTKVSAFLWIGESEMPFAYAWAKRSNLTVNFMHPEHDGSLDSFFDSTDLDKMGYEIVKKLQKTKEIAWTQSML